MFDTAGSIIVLPERNWTERETAIEYFAMQCPNRPIVNVVAQEEPARICAALTASTLISPASVVAYGTSCQMLPAVSLAMRTQKMPIYSYVLIDPEIPQPTDTWPECPVTIMCSEGSNQADRLRLYGWPVVVTDRIIEAAASALVVN